MNEIIPSVMSVMKEVKGVVVCNMQTSGGAKALHSTYAEQFLGMAYAHEALTLHTNVLPTRF